MCGIHGKVYVWTYVNQASLWSNVAGICKCPTSLVESFILEFYEISVHVFRRLYQMMSTYRVY
jgi:hypothetical protein